MSDSFAKYTKICSAIVDEINKVIRSIKKIDRTPQEEDDDEYY